MRDAPATIDIRNEKAEDYPAIHEVNRRAFGGNGEAILVDMLRQANKAVVSLVAVVDSQVVGHILFSPITVETAPEGFRGLGLAPLSVLPEFQNRGIGSKLAHSGLNACRSKSYDAVAVLGHPSYYSRFGFQRAMDCGLGNEYGADDAFMVMELRNGVLGTIRGLIRYAPEFSALPDESH